MTDDEADVPEPDDEPEVQREPLPAFAEEKYYLRTVASLSVPTCKQIADFIKYVATSESWYRHLPARPPGSPMSFYLDPNAGRDRLRRRGDRVIYRDRTEHTERFHNSWMTTQNYRQRFGYLAFCCPDVTSEFMTEMLRDGIATLDPNVSSPLIEGAGGRLSQVPKTVLDAGTCLVTRTIHSSTDAGNFWYNWTRGRDKFSDDQAIAAVSLTGRWPRIAMLCNELASEAPSVYEYLRTRPYPLPPLLPDSYPADKEEAVRHFKALEIELTALIRKQRDAEHEAMAKAITVMLEFVKSSVRATN